ncbi:MAG: hypothetical protein KW793_02215, partial [Candidatus Doudnabacteria bacterium]|nr:hypothetical protein [Candidatus Doudnabacteria bacterium]
DGRNIIVQEDKSITISNSTVIQKVSIKDGKLIVIEGNSSDVKQGKSLAVYTSRNPAGTDVLQADKIEIIEI